MSEILINISLLDGFISREDISQELVAAELRGVQPGVCEKYGGPDHGGGDPEDRRGYC